MRAEVFDSLLRALRPFVSAITARTVVESAMRRQRIGKEMLEKHGVTEALTRAIDRSLAMYLGSTRQRRACRAALQALGEDALAGGGEGEFTRERVRVCSERDVVLARSKARDLAASLGFDATEQIKIVTAVSELSRNICAYAGEGEIIFRKPAGGKPGLEIEAVDQGPGIPNLGDVLAGEFKSRTGMGLGLRGCKRIMTHFRVESSPGRGTRVVMSKLLSA